MHSSLAWWGLAESEGGARLEKLVDKIRRAGYLPPTTPSMYSLATNFIQRNAE